MSTLIPSLLLLTAPAVQDPGVQDTGAAPTWPVLRQVVIDLEEHPGLDWLGLEFDVYLRPRPNDPRLFVLADEVELERLRSLGITYTVVVEDQTAFYQSRLDPGGVEEAGSLGAFLNPPFGQGQMGGYYTFAQIESVLDQMTAAYPAITTTKSSLGTSHEGRPLWMVKVSDNPDTDENEPEVRFDSLHHAREPEGMQATLWMMLFLLEGYGTDPLATYLVDNREIYFVPVVNPDGYVYNQQIAPGGGGMWRKNRRNNGGGVFGVDLNRNYPFEWGPSPGSSGDPSNDLYRGPSAGSEPETQAILAFMATRSFGTALSTHTFSDLWFYPFGYDFIAPANQADYDELSELATEVNGYVYGPGAIVLYQANGVTIDQDHAVHGTMSWTPEIGSSSDGFWPPTSQIIPLAEENLLGFQRTALGAGAFVYAIDASPTDAGDGDGDFEAGETVEFNLTARNSGRVASGTVTATLQTSSPDATVLDGSHSFGSIGGFSQKTTGGTPLAFQINPGTPSGTQIAYSLTVDYEGYVQNEGGVITVGELRDFLTDNVEVDLGWTTGLPSDTASTGLWTRGNPIGTTSSGQPSNPEDDLTPGAGVNCFVTGNGGGSAGDDDVDDGLTTLISPQIDLSGVGPAKLSYGRWYTLLSQADDVFQVSISNDDGQNWTPLETVSTNQNSWQVQTFTVSDVLSQTAEMRLRFIAEDDPNNSLVEAAIDELKIGIYDEDPRFNVFGKPEIGTPVALHVTGDAGAAFTLFFSANTGSVTIPGVEGTILLDLATSVPLFSGTIPGSGLSRSVSTIPDNPATIGQTVYLQALVVGGTVAVTNRDEITIE